MNAPNTALLIPNPVHESSGFEVKGFPCTTGVIMSLHPLCCRSSFMQARDAITAMRESHEKNGCGLFAFTVLRSPLEWVVSLYDDICHRRLKGHTDTCPQKARYILRGLAATVLAILMH